FGVVDPVEGRLVAVEDDLDLFVGPGRSHPVAQRPRLFRQAGDGTFDPLETDAAATQAVGIAAADIATHPGAADAAAGAPLRLDGDQRTLGPGLSGLGRVFAQAGLGPELRH